MSEKERALQILEETSALVEDVLVRDSNKAEAWDLKERGQVLALLAWQAQSDPTQLLAAICTAGVFGYVRGWQAGLQAGRAEVLERMVREA